MKRALLMIAGMLMVLVLWSVPAEQFVIGAYTQYILSISDPPEKVFGDLGTQLQGAGYNTALYSMSSDETITGRLQAALNELSKRGISSVLDDWSMPDKGPVGVTVMANGNYLKMEAEYILDYKNGTFKPDVLPKDDSANDKYNYVFRHGTGNRSAYDVAKYSNGYAWICDEKENHHEGLALTEPRFRWKPDDRQISRLICYDLRFLPSIKNNRLYLVVALDWSDVQSGDKVADVALTALKNSSLDSRSSEFGVYTDDAYQSLDIKPLYPDLYGTTIYNQEYPGIKRDPLTGFALFEYYVDIPRPGTQLFKDLIRIDFFNHINPRIYWHGEGKFAIDYVEFEDEPYRALSGDTPNHPLRARMLERIEQIDKLDNSASMLYYYAKDEPFQGQFATYGQLQRVLREKGQKLIAAIHLEGTKNKKPGKLDDFFHAGLFMKEAKPEVMMLDAYPLQEWGDKSGSLIRWNDDVKNANFVQNKMETVLIANYYKLTSAINRDPELRATKLYFVAQTFGEKYEPIETGEWRFFMPPRSMLKCLQLMPLCYAADGIVDFAITADRTSRFPAGNRFYNRVTPLSHGTNYTDLQSREGETFYQSLADANAKINVYGPILQKLNWVDADSIMVRGEHPRIDLDNFKLKSLQVVDSDNGSYQGYVQCGWYLDNRDTPSFMLVNRRAVYENPGSPDVIPVDVDNYFTDAEPQTVRFVLNKKYSGAYALFDPFSKKHYYGEKGRIDVPLAAGDGILLQLVPLPVPGQGNNSNAKDETLLSGKVTVEPKTTLLLPADTRTVIAPNTTILVGKKATLDIRSNTSFGSGVRIILEPGAKLKMDRAKVVLAPDTIIEKQKRPCFLKRLFGKKN